VHGHGASLSYSESKPMNIDSDLTPLLVTERQAAKLLGVCPKTIYNLTKAGKLARVPIMERGVRYSLESINRFIKSEESFCTAA
jgi:hypothetical protein